MTEKKQIRCINCNNIIANGHIKEGVVEIDCRHCKTKNRLEAEQVTDDYNDTKYGKVRIIKETGITRPNSSTMVTKG